MYPTTQCASQLAGGQLQRKVHAEMAMVAVKFKQRNVASLKRHTALKSFLHDLTRSVPRYRHFIQSYVEFAPLMMQLDPGMSEAIRAPMERLTFLLAAAGPTLSVDAACELETELEGPLNAAQMHLAQQKVKTRSALRRVREQAIVYLPSLKSLLVAVEREEALV